MDWLSILLSAAGGGLLVWLLQFFTQTYSMRLQLKWTERHRLYFEVFDAVTKHAALLQQRFEQKFGDNPIQDEKYKELIFNLVQDIDFMGMQARVKVLASQRLAREFAKFELEVGYCWRQLVQFDEAKSKNEDFDFGRYKATTSHHLKQMHAQVSAIEVILRHELALADSAIMKRTSNRNP